MGNEIAELVVTFFDETFKSIFTDSFCEEIDDFRTRRRVQRKIEEAAEVASQALERFLLNEQIDSETAEQMLKHLGRTLESGGVNAEWLAQPGLNPDSLAENLLADNPCPSIRFKRHIDNCITEMVGSELRGCGATVHLANVLGLH